MDKLRAGIKIFIISPQKAIYGDSLNAVEATSYIVGNQTEAIQYLTNRGVLTTKGLLTVDSGKQTAMSIFKGGRDAARRDSLCTELCISSEICETLAGVLIYVPIPYMKYGVIGLKT
jgi:hypothetical protein